MRSGGGAVDPAQVADVTPSVLPGITVQYFPPVAPARDAHAIVKARHRREVEHAEHEMVRRPAPADHADHALAGVAAVDPGESRRVEVQLVERRFRAIESVEVLDPLLEAA
jgi:hypothetical protein